MPISKIRTRKGGLPSRVRAQNVHCVFSGWKSSLTSFEQKVGRGVLLRAIAFPLPVLTML